MQVLKCIPESNPSCAACSTMRSEHRARQQEVVVDATARTHSTARRVATTGSGCRLPCVGSSPGFKLAAVMPFRSCVRALVGLPAFAWAGHPTGMELVPMMLQGGASSSRRVTRKRGAEQREERCSAVNNFPGSFLGKYGDAFVATPLTPVDPRHDGGIYAQYPELSTPWAADR
jgi:hypothetical protein